MPVLWRNEGDTRNWNSITFRSGTWRGNAWSNTLALSALHHVIHKSRPGYPLAGGSFSRATPRSRGPKKRESGAFGVGS